MARLHVLVWLAALSFILTEATSIRLGRFYKPLRLSYAYDAYTQDAKQKSSHCRNPKWITAGVNCPMKRRLSRLSFSDLILRVTPLSGPDRRR